MAGSVKATNNRPGAIGILITASLWVAMAADAQTQQDLERCASKDGVAPDLRIASCTAWGN